MHHSAKPNAARTSPARFPALILERLPCVADGCCEVKFPRTLQGPRIDDLNACDVVLERVLQAKVSNIYFEALRALNKTDLGYDQTHVEDQYAKLSSAFISKMPRVFTF